mmetsp:Transcript_12263/g.37414  ORF Transcript_12263/g.37414 Transcript_12263/m.37414 type:complete len:101 (+) Transcript_12263:465-767(+)
MPSNHSRLKVRRVQAYCQTHLCPPMRMWTPVPIRAHVMMSRPIVTRFVRHANLPSRKPNRLHHVRLDAVQNTAVERVVVNSTRNMKQLALASGFSTCEKG